MGKAIYSIDEIRMNFRDPELIEVFVCVTIMGDVPLGVQGWHHKTFPSRVPGLDIYTAMFTGEDNPVLWHQETPPSRP